MATKVYMEALSPTMEEGRLISWLKKEGDEVAEGDVLAEVETDKATMELVARGAGVLRKLLVAEGDTANVGTMIGVVAGADEDISSLLGDGGGDAGSAAPKAGEDGGERGAAEEDGEKAGDEPTAEERKPAKAEAPTDGGGTEAGAAKPDAGSAADDGSRVKASPLARRLAKDSGVELGGVKGSGPGGRIVKRDVEAAMEGGAPATEEREAAPAAPAPSVPAPEPRAGDAYRDVPLSQMRKTIARRLTQSIGPVPHFFLTVEIDMGEAMQLRKRINERFADEGIRVSPNDLVIKATAMALRKHPWVNAAWTGEAVRQFDVVHVGIAVAVDEGLITPVVRDADRKGVTEIAQEVKELAGRAREKKLKPDEYTGSTFSISNLGMFGIEEFTAVINPPEAAILAVGAAQDKVVVVDGEMTVRSRMRVTLSCDHRVIDGATGAQFLQTLKRFLEDPMMMVA
jgi:pyruvate dehydrogenase E2 component (dihydrolipoamide acetyltransferase)